MQECSVDTCSLRAEGVIPPYYDSLIAKLIVRGKDRGEAVSRMARALEMFIVEGVYTTIPGYRKILADPDFRAGKFDTGSHRAVLAKPKDAGADAFDPGPRSEAAFHVGNFFHRRHFCAKPGRMRLGYVNRGTASAVFHAMILFPRLYAIVDSSAHESTQGLLALADALIAGGCTLLQYRNKGGNARVMLEQATQLRRLSRAGVPAPHVRLIMDDRADLCVVAEFDGVHVGQDDLSPQSVRKIIGPDRH